MKLKLAGDGVHFWCSSPTVARKLLEKRARLIDEAQAEYLRPALKSATPAEGPRRDRRFPLGAEEWLSCRTCPRRKSKSLPRHGGETWSTS
jgi:hypothetical protein